MTIDAAAAGLEETADSLVDACEGFEHGQPARALEAAARAREKMTEQSEPYLRFRALGCEAWALAAKGRTVEASAHADQLRRLSLLLDDPVDQVNALRRRAAVHHRLGNLEESVDLLGEALQIAEQNDLRTQNIDLLTNLAVYQSEAQRYDLAISQYHRALDLLDPGDDPRQRLPILYNLGLTYRSADRLDEAAETLENLIEPLQQPGLEVRLASLFAILGSIQREKGNFDQAEDYFARSARLHEELDNPAEYTALLIDRSQLYLARDDIERALEASAEALGQARRSDYHFSIRGALRVRIDVLAAAGRYAEALALEQERAERMVDYLNQQQRSRLAQLEAEVGVAVRERELVELRRESDLQRVELERQVQRQQIGTGLVVAFVLLGVGLILWQRGHNRRLRKLSRTDLLTGLPNRRDLTEMLSKADDDGRLLVMLLDLDHFKQINDSYGHDLGDHALVALATTLRQFASQHAGHAGRWGGEEFLLLLRENQPERAAALAGQLLEQIAALRIERVSGAPLQITASLGFTPLASTARHSGQEMWEPALLIADQLMYRAKQAGRNRYCGAWPAEPNKTLHPRRLEEQILAGECRVFEGAVEIR